MTSAIDGGRSPSTVVITSSSVRPERVGGSGGRHVDHPGGLAGAGVAFDAHPGVGDLTRW